MNLQKFKRHDSMVASKKPYISIGSNEFTFNAAFVKQAGLESQSRVTIFLDPEERVIGLKFHDDQDDPDSYRLSSLGNRTPRRTKVRKLMKEHEWIGQIAKLGDSDLMKFKPEYKADEDVWLIHLCPAFENKVSNTSEIQSDTKGIYRYLLDDKIVYIGRGIVRSRANAPERKTWDFDTIEYSVIEDTDKQDYWETFFLDKFVAENERLPRYNKILGKTQKSET